jgi:hypothetical protein
MEMKLFGIKFRPLIVVSCVIIGIIIGCYSICSCSHMVKEAFGANTGYDMSNGVTGSYGNKKLESLTQNLESNRGPVLPLVPGEMFFFANNEFTPECCVPPFSSVSSADGCACVTKEQVDYINMRGGNRTYSEVF